MDLQELPMWHVTTLAFHLNAKLDKGAAVPWYDDVRSKVVDGTLFEWLRVERVTPGFAPDSPEAACLLDFFEGLASAVDPKRKFMVDQNGYAVLLACCIEAVQQKTPL